MTAAKFNGEIPVTNIQIDLVIIGDLGDCFTRVVGFHNNFSKITKITAKDFTYHFPLYIPKRQPFQLIAYLLKFKSQDPLSKNKTPP